jgi:threonyl-tRNA synthetase
MPSALTIRAARLQKAPYLLIMGDKEQAAGMVSVRLRSGEDLGALPIAGLVARMVDEASRKAGSPGST